MSDISESGGKSKWAEKQKADKETLRENAGRYANKAFADPQKLNTFLCAQGRLCDMSAANVLLVSEQLPGATLLREYGEWNDSGRSIGSGEHGVKILKKTGEFTREDGTTGAYFGVRTVFDVSQTGGNGGVELPEQPDKQSCLEALMQNGELPADEASMDKQFFAIAREYAQARKMDDFLCDCVANVVCARFGFDGADITDIPKEISERDEHQKSALLDSVRSAARGIIKQIEHPREKHDVTAAPRLSKEEYIQQKQDEKQAMYDAVSELTEQVWSEADKYDAFLLAQARFPGMTLSNTLLIMASCPQATELNDAAGWKEQGVYIKKGEKAIKLWALAGYYARKDGSKAPNYVVRSVFDVLQTNDERDIEQTPPSRAVIGRAFLDYTRIPVAPNQSVAEDQGAMLIAQDDKAVIIVNDTIGPDTGTFCIARELARYELQEDDDYDRVEFIAQSAATVVCRKYGFMPPADGAITSPNDVLGAEYSEVQKREVLNAVHNQASQIISRTDKNIATILAEQHKNAPDKTPER